MRNLHLVLQEEAHQALGWGTFCVVEADEMVTHTLLSKLPARRAQSFKLQADSSPVTLINPKP